MSKWCWADSSVKFFVVLLLALSVRIWQNWSLFPFVLKNLFFLWPLLYYSLLISFYFSGCYFTLFYRLLVFFLTPSWRLSHWTSSLPQLHSLPSWLLLVTWLWIRFLNLYFQSGLCPRSPDTYIQLLFSIFTWMSKRHLKLTIIKIKAVVYPIKPASHTLFSPLVNGNFTLPAA